MSELGPRQQVKAGRTTRREGAEPGPRESSERSPRIGFRDERGVGLADMDVLAQAGGNQRMVELGRSPGYDDRYRERNGSNSYGPPGLAHKAKRTASYELCAEETE